MKAATLVNAMGGNITRAYADQLIDGCNEAMTLAGCTTVNRAAMFLAQIREESVGLKYTQEIGQYPPDQWQTDPYLTGQRYFPYIGRTFIQVTWDYNYRSLGSWLHLHGLLDNQDEFVTYPAHLAYDKWAWHGPAWYWVTHPDINQAADRGDVKAATEIINGGLNGYSTRLVYWNHIRPLGEALLPEGTPMNVLHPGLLRAVMEGGKYATKRLKKKYPRMVHQQGALPRLANHANQITQLQRRIEKLEQEIKK